MENKNAVLGVENSLTSQYWAAREASPELVSEIIRQTYLPEVVARLLAIRGVNPEDVQFFLEPTFKEHLPDPYILKDMEKAVKRIVKAIRSNEKIGIFGDYDVDGATSSAVLSQFLDDISDCDIQTRIPERSEGYGPTIQAMKDFVAADVSLIITVDNGTTAFEALEPIAEQGTDILVVDHHEPDVVLPKVCAVVNPKRLDEPVNNPCRHMAAVGVVFMLIVAINRLLREKGWYDDGRKEPDLMRWLDMVALGTVCDVVQLRGLNRLFVKSGLSHMARRENKGLCVLSDISRIKEKPSAYHLGFVIGPRLNACGRIGKADLGLKLLCAKDEAEATDIAKKLDELNVIRRQMCEEIYKQALMLVESKDKAESIIFVHGKDWHAGVIGIIAGRMKERYKVPALVMSVEGETTRGSGRSVAGMDLGAAVLAAKEKGILIYGGGHAMAAGFTIKTDRLDEFKDFLIDYFKTHQPKEEKDNAYLIDSIVDIGAVSWSLVEKLTAMEPFGEGNPEPRFALADVAVASAYPVGSGHITCSFIGRNGRSRLRGIAFRAADSILGTTLLNHKGALFHIAGYIRPDTYRGEGNVQFIIEDIAIAN